jgi:hypothetical protein
MECTTSGDTLGRILPDIIGRAARVTITTVGGDQLDAYAPISIAFDHVAFRSSIGSANLILIRWDAIAAIAVYRN